MPKLTSQFAGLMLIGAISIANATSAASVTIGTDSGIGGNCVPFGCPAQLYEQVYNARRFSGPVLIQSVSFTRIDASGKVNVETRVAPNTIVAGNYTLGLSTTQRPVDGLSLTLEQNIGSNRETMFSGTLSGTPKALTLAGSPFLYDPARGNLILDIVGPTSGVGNIFFDAASESGSEDFARAFRVSGGVGYHVGTGLVTTFETKSAPSFASVLSGAVSLAPSGHDMLADFTPGSKLTLDQAAQLGGFDHFNWIQYALVYPGHSTPFLDPPFGGLGLQKADHLPFYWDETSEPGLEPTFALASNRTSRTLSFTDTPENFFVIPGLTYMSFYTTLVGVYDNNTWEPLHSFSWKSDYNPIFGGGVSFARNLDSPPAGDGGIFDVVDLSNPLDVPPELLALWRENGGLFTVPEPATWAMLIAGFGLVGAELRRRARSHANNAPSQQDRCVRRRLAMPALRRRHLPRPHG